MNSLDLSTRFWVVNATPQIRLTHEPSHNVIGLSIKSINPNLTQVDLLLAS